MPSKLVFSAGECWYCLISVTVCLAAFTDTRTARPARTVGGPPPSSNIVSEPSGCSTASCWNAVLVPGPCVKLCWFEPSTHITAPVERLIL